MSLGDLSRTPEHSRPASTRNPSDRLIGTVVAPDDDTQAQDAFLQHLVVKQPSYAPRYARKSNTNYTSSIGSVAADRTPSSLFELKQQRLLAAADRKKRIIARIVSIVGLLIILLCAAIVTLTLKMAPKIDELVRSKAGAHQLIHIVTRMSTSTMAPSSLSTASTTTTTTTTTSSAMSATARRLTMIMITATTTHLDNQTANSTLFERILNRHSRRPF